jgi:hypothetical protein
MRFREINAVMVYFLKNAIGLKFKRTRASIDADPERYPRIRQE